MFGMEASISTSLYLVGNDAFGHKKRALQKV